MRKNSCTIALKSYCRESAEPVRRYDVPNSSERRPKISGRTSSRARSKYISDRVARSSGGDVGVKTFVARAKVILSTPSHDLRTVRSPSVLALLYVARNDSSCMQGSIRLTVEKYNCSKSSASCGVGRADGSTVRLFCPPRELLGFAGRLKKAPGLSPADTSGPSMVGRNTLIPACTG
jgi:hypothetical protein